MNTVRESSGQGNFGLAWFLLCLAFCAHVADEALTGFLPIYNATVLAMRNQYRWYPMPTFEYRNWLTGLIIATIHLLNGMGHTLATIFGRTASSIHFSRPAPGFYSSPLLLAGSIYLFIRLRASRRSQSQAATS
jgi:hypothetical protein